MEKVVKGRMSPCCVALSNMADGRIFPVDEWIEEEEKELNLSFKDKAVVNYWQLKAFVDYAAKVGVDYVYITTYVEHLSIESDGLAGTNIKCELWLLDGSDGSHGQRVKVSLEYLKKYFMTVKPASKQEEITLYVADNCPLLFEWRGIQYLIAPRIETD